MSQAGTFSSGGGGGISLLSFLATQTTDSTDVTGDNTVFILGSDAPLTIINDSASTITNGMTFTAPATGTYYLGMSAYVQWDVTDNHAPTIYQLHIITTHRTYINDNVGGPTASTDVHNNDAFIGFSFGTVAPMNSGDTATFGVVLNNPGNPGLIVSVIGTATTNTSIFGFRIN